MANQDRQQAIKARCFHPSGTFVEFPRTEIEQSIPERFGKIVRIHPERLAIKTKEAFLTYDELNQATNRVARCIVELRGSSSEPIAILLEHGAPVVVGILATLKAGKFYVPLDSSHPVDRLRYILEDTRASLILTSKQNLPLACELAQNKAYQLLNVDEIKSEASLENLNFSTSPEDNAYILYTSGTTGQPKGVIQNHRNVLHKIMVWTNMFRITTADRLTLLHSCGYSASVDNLFGSLLNGAALFPFNVNQEGLYNLAAWLRREEITILHSVSSVFRELARAIPRNERFAKLRVIKVGAEQVTSKDFELYREFGSDDSIFVTGLGTNETGRIAYDFLDKSTVVASGPLPAGYAVSDKEIFIVDDAGNKLSAGHVGQIAVKSRYLSPGYWKRPELTAKAFAPSRDGAQERIYFTGDLGRILPDGCLVYLGRKDAQVKIRGIRIEVAEIESALRDFDGIREVVVVDRLVRPDEKLLVAYIVSTPGSSLNTGALRRFLSAKLPDQMIPSFFVALDALPLTPNGKVDRKSLPEPGKSRPELDTPYVAPRIPIEEQLTKIWAVVLGIDQVGIYDNFFDLGGHSLAASRVVSRVIQTFQLDLPVQSLFQSPTVAEMAAVIAKHPGSNLGEKELENVLDELQALSEEEAQRLLSDQSKKAGKGN